MEMLQVIGEKILTFLNAIISFGNTYIGTYLLIVLLLIAGFYFTFKLKFVQFRMFKDMIKFQAFCISTASRVGTGNIAGVALAIAVGGAGSVFWMWIIALIGGASSFVESTLAQIYKVKDASGAYRGGPAYYIEKGLQKHSTRRLEWTNYSWEFYLRLLPRVLFLVVFNELRKFQKLSFLY